MSDITASPTKGFFVDMITRDIPLDRAILDLIDNSIDGAQRLVVNDEFAGLFVRLTINEDVFKIIDNCGGIPIDIAKNQAFRFGKPKVYDAPKHSIGRFGIGMKRALFKIGNNFSIDSIHKKSTFKISLNVPSWLSADGWDFDFETSEEGLDNVKTLCKTDIMITELHANISSEFREQYFITELKKEIALAHSLIMKKGFKIYINDDEVFREKFNLKYGEKLKPFIVNVPYILGEDKSVNIKIFAGLDNRDLNKGGWNIFCNNRLILDADQSVITGWDTEVDGNEKKINKYHSDYAYFRGYVLFDSSDAALLPWTTTKTGLDSDSEIYKAAFFEMRKILKVIMSFLSKRAKQDAKFKNDELDSNPLTRLIEKDTISIEFLELPQENQNFFYQVDEPNVIEKEPEPKGGTVSYWKKEEELNIMKDYLGVNTNKEVGKITFDYYLHLIKAD